MASTESKAVKNAQATERKTRAFEYHKRGHTYRRIAKKLGVSHVQVFRDVQEILATARKECSQSAEDLISMELERLDMAMTAIAPMVDQGDVKGIDRWIRISESRRKLLGLDADANVDQMLRYINMDKLTYRQLQRLSAGEHPIKVLFGADEDEDN